MEVSMMNSNITGIDTDLNVTSTMIPTNTMDSNVTSEKSPDVEFLISQVTGDAPVT
jgi:hypothetical protein